MTSISEYLENTYIRMILEGDSGAGKTGSIVSLIAAGYYVRFLDLEGKLRVVAEYVYSSKSQYAEQLKEIDLSKAFDAITITDAEGSAAWSKIRDVTKNWPNFGKPSEWGSDTILVIDSNTALTFHAMRYTQRMNNHSVESKGPEWLRDLGEAQRLVEQYLTAICSSLFHCHVILITHLQPMGDNMDGVFVNPSPIPITTKDNKTASPPPPPQRIRQFPLAMGRALTPKIPRLFGDIYLAVEEGPQRRIYTTPKDGAIVKSSAPLSVKPYYSLSTGLAEIFQELRRGAVPQKAASAPVSLAPVAPKTAA